jgi:hypothetical protein
MELEQAAIGPTRHSQWDIGTLCGGQPRLGVATGEAGQFIDVILGCLS